MLRLGSVLRAILGEMEWLGKGERGTEIEGGFLEDAFGFSAFLMRINREQSLFPLLFLFYFLCCLTILFSKI